MHGSMVGVPLCTSGAQIQELPEGVKNALPCTVSEDVPGPTYSWMPIAVPPSVKGGDEVRGAE